MYIWIGIRAPTSQSVSPCTFALALYMYKTCCGLTQTVLLVLRQPHEATQSLRLSQAQRVIINGLTALRDTKSTPFPMTTFLMYVCCVELRECTAMSHL